MESHSYVKPDGHSIKSSPKLENECLWQFWLVFGEFLEIPVIAWYIETGNTKILVDTGMCETARAHQYHYRHSKQNQEERIDKALELKDIQIQDIDIVILTHLHWDHCSNIDLFDHAICYLQRKELDYANDPIPSYYSSYESPHIGLVPSYNKTKFELLSGDTETDSIAGI